MHEIISITCQVTNVNLSPFCWFCSKILMIIWHNRNHSSYSSPVLHESDLVLHPLSNMLLEYVVHEE